MGDTPSKYEEPLQPQQMPIWAVDRKFCTPTGVTLRLREKVFSFSGDDFKVTDTNTDQLWFRIGGRAFSFREKKTLCDNEGNPVLNMKESLMSMFEPNYKIYRGDDSAEEMFKVVAHITFAKAKAHTTITNQENGQQLTIVLKGDLRSKHGCIYIGEPKQGGIPIAKIYRPFNERGYFLDAQDYYLEIAPNVDASMCVAICVCLDEMKKDK